MSQRYDLPGQGEGPFVAGNDLVIGFTLTTASPPGPLDISALTLTVYLKASATTPDSLAAVFTTSSGVTVTSAPDGQFTWAIPHASIPPADAPGSLWYRVDLTGAGNTETAMFGALVLTAA